MKKTAWSQTLSSLLLGMIMTSMIGCTWQGPNGTNHLIFGVGFVLITTTNKAGLDARQTTGIGALAGSEGVGLGFMSYHRVMIDPEAASNVVVSIKTHPGSMTVKNFDSFSTIQPVRQK